MSTPPHSAADQQSAVGTSTSGTSEDSDAREPSESLLDRYGRNALAGSMRVTGFWIAIALPFLYIPLLATGLDSMSKLATFLLLVSLNIVALVVGHQHNLD